MANSTSSVVGVVEELWRYPVKSMLGEQVTTTEVTETGLLGDRAYALRDVSDGKIATAKNPRKWPNLFSYRAVLTGTPAGEKVPPARITFPDGTTISTEPSDAALILSAALKREVRLEKIGGGRGTPASKKETSEEYWLDMEGLEHQDTVTDFNLPQGTFFDTGMVHVLTTATLDRLHDFYPEGIFAIPRFRQNIVVRPTDSPRNFVEDTWLGRTIAVGERVRLKIDLNCARCVMTTLNQNDLPKDPGILRTVAQYNRVNVGVYASVLQGGMIQGSDPVWFE
jgi:uncharacterized protein YcbX